MKEGKKYLTKEKFKELQAELQDLISVKRREVAEQLEHSKSMGDLKENAEYHEARDSQAKLEARISELENTIKNAEMLKHHKGDTVDVGSTVAIQKVKETEVHTYDIVGPEEADMTAGRLSHESPLGRSLIGKKKGDEFSIETPKGKVGYRVVDVR